MGQEYFINSQELESKVRELLPSQGGAGAGFDLSASTQIIPIIDLTESAEGSNVRQDLQTAFSFKTTADTSVSNSTTTIISNTGYWHINYNVVGKPASGSGTGAGILINDGATDKIAFATSWISNSTGYIALQDSIVIKLEAGHSIKLDSSSSDLTIRAQYRQIADINGVLIDP